MLGTIDHDKPPVALDNSHDIQELSNAKLNASDLTGDRLTAYNNLTQKLNLPESVALLMASGMTDQQVETYAKLVSGQDTITPQEARKVWNLSDDEYIYLFGNSGADIAFDVPISPFSAITRQVAALAYALEIDIQKLLMDTRQKEHDLAVDSAKDTLHGAIGAFALNMMAGLCTMAVGITSGKFNKGKKENNSNLDPKKPEPPKDKPDNHNWPAAMTASLISQPLQAIGEFIDRNFQYESALTEADKNQVHSWYEQLVAALSQTRELSR